jgi:hypothetical protein
LSVSAVLDAGVDRLWEGRTSVSVSRRGRLRLVLRVAIEQNAGGVASFRFSGPWSGVNGGDSFWIHSSKKKVFAAAPKGDNGRVAAMMMASFGSCPPALQDTQPG